MQYAIRHITRFRYSVPVRESIMEVKMHPRSESLQRCLSFQLSVSPKTRVTSYRDHRGNQVHHFNVPGQHTHLMIVTDTTVSVEQPTSVPDRLEESAWDELDQAMHHDDFHEYLVPSALTKPSDLLQALAKELDLVRRDDPLSLLRNLNYKLYKSFDYVKNSTRVDSTIQQVLQTRKGVCQDFTHVMIALTRGMGIPSRYVSGYMYHGGNRDRSTAGATHAWAEAFLPGLGWVGFDPTNNRIAAERHIRTAVGRDYNDVPPTRGVFKGFAKGELSVSVAVVPSDQGLTLEPELVGGEDDWTVYEDKAAEPEETGVRAQQEQQQQSSLWGYKG